VGLDVDLSKLDKSTSIFDFNRKIIDATSDFVCAFKPNSAFYEMYGTKGIEALAQTIEYIQQKDIPVILDAKRGDIGNSSTAYAKAAFEFLKADAITVVPYMGEDSIKPFLDYKDKGVFILCLTSNPGSKDFQTQNDLYKQVAQKAVKWNKNNNCCLVVGATKPEQLKEIRNIARDMLILIPGIGAQGGDLGKVIKTGGKRIIINSSRSIIYSPDPKAAAQKLRDEINNVL